MPTTSIDGTECGPCAIDRAFEAITEAVKRERKIVAIAFDMTSLDYAKAYKDYADAIGITTDELTRQQKQQAVMDLILEETQDVYDEAIEESEDVWKTHGPGCWGIEE